MGRLIVLYDDNGIQIDGETDLAFSEDVLMRFQSYGWHTLTVEDGDCDLNGILAAIEQAKIVTDKPSIIKVRTTIGYGSKMQGTEKVRIYIRNFYNWYMEYPFVRYTAHHLVQKTLLRSSKRPGWIQLSISTSIPMFVHSMNEFENLAKNQKRHGTRCLRITARRIRTW